MAHFGIFCPPMKGHLNTMLSIARKLQRNNHRVTFFQVADLEPYVTAHAEFCKIGSDEYPAGALKELDLKLSQLSGRSAHHFAVERFRRYAEVFLQQAPHKVRDAGIDVLLVDQAEAYGGSIAELLSIPFISIASALPFNPESGIPPLFTAWAYSRNPLARLRNIIGYRLYCKSTNPVRELVNQYRVQWGLRPLPMEWEKRGEAYSKLAQISQLPTCLDFPREQLPATFHAVGLLMDETIRGNIPFPWERVDGRPLIYACLGTLQNGQAHIFRAIAEACENLQAQLVISLGGDTLSESAIGKLAGNPIVVRYAPQDQLLQRTSLLITHGSLNTTLEALGYGVPMVAIPIANDQPGVASRVAWHGVGEVMNLKQLTTERLREKITKVWSDPKYREKAQQIQSQLKSNDALQLACEIIERAIPSQRSMAIA
jgi:zeaxanthin glucosyltransferase